ncbi:hypothetical protein [Mycolicibacterium komossense]|uniref:Alanine rich protein n=1 Tax=Mycolicibacterium komossense TaxID=1779 RepID=A0ABT3C5I0_9MYCO|nr:hypothetical protein [Mycolicibacterium komossense]MCV7224710.1 hypothetical protein [Mycolicibacterium komossense]
MTAAAIPHTGAVVNSPPDPAGGHQVIEPPAGATHSVRPGDRRLRLIAAITGLAAVVAAIGVGTAALVRSPAAMTSTVTTANFITVSVPPAAVPLSAPQIAGLLGEPPDFGALGEPARRASCLTGLGYPGTTTILGATPVQINNRPGVLLVLEGDSPAMLTALAVAPNCSSAGTGLLADTAVPRP